ncbi:MAG TPA: hypothetical protein VFI06_06825 [Chitinophagaceae bacterium]|nr:hypothetical protein [Chitinophagaceae bacterium]
MQTERSIKSILTGKLDGLGLPASSSFKKEKAWEKLQLRLDSSKRTQRKKAIILGLSVPVAAAAFYFLVGLGNNEAVEKIDHTVASKPGIIVTTPQTSTPFSKTAISLPPGNKTQEVRTIAKKHTEEIKTKELIPMTVIEPAPVQPVDLAVTPNPQAKMPVSQRKWRVVHNNELEGPVTPAPDERNTVAFASRPHLIPGFRKPGLDNFEEISEDTVRKHKSKLSILPFSGLISQKQ